MAQPRISVGLEGTERIGFGAGVAVPSLRHPMVTASAIATIEELAPGRLVAAFGTGFTARRTLGQKAMRWADLATYVEQLRTLLAGGVTEIDGRACQMIQPPGWAPERPIGTPIWVAPSGPKGFATARGLDVDGVALMMPPAEDISGFAETALLVSGTVVRGPAPRNERRRSHLRRRRPGRPGRALRVRRRGKPSMM